MTDNYWTPRLVETYLAEAVNTLRRQSPPRPTGAMVTWPRVIRDAWANHEFAQLTPVGPSSPRAIEQMDAILSWLHWLDYADQRIVWDRANRSSWKSIAHTHGMHRTTAWRRWTHALVAIASRLNGGGDATLLQHQSEPHREQHLVE
jgi:hypothetical protein